MCNIDKKSNLSPMMTEQGKNELYLYSLKKMENGDPEKKQKDITGLYGIIPFFYYANEIMRNNKELNYAVIRMDIYRFKTVNEFCGRSEGDRLLEAIGRWFSEYITDKAVAGHFRADIFALCISFEKEQELIDIVTQIKTKIDSYPLECKAFPSFGICIRRDEMDISLMCDYADLALQGIKGKAFKCYEFYTNEIREKILFEKRIENEISDALCNGEIKMYVQPKVNMKSEKIIGAEALIRWQIPGEGFLGPDKFIPVIENSGHIIEVDKFIWEKAFNMQSRLISRGIPIVPVSVNVSLIDIYQNDFTSIWCELADKYNVSPEYIQLEVTESIFSNNNDEIFNKIIYLQDKGFKFLMDDFGSGYSSLNMLKSEPVDEVKLDRVFLSNINDRKSRIVIKGIIQMIKELDLNIIAEGVENEEQAEFLMKHGCVNAQGYKYYKPMPEEEYEKVIEQKCKQDN